MIVNRRTAALLVWGYQPFVSPRQNVVGKLASVGPPGISIDAKAQQPTLALALEGQLRWRHIGCAGPQLNHLPNDLQLAVMAPSGKLGRHLLSRAGRHRPLLLMEIGSGHKQISRRGRLSLRLTQ